MAAIKRRIMTRSQILQTMFDRSDRKPSETRDYETASHDFAAYLLADGKDVCIAHDVNMGGMVVIYNDGK